MTQRRTYTTDEIAEGLAALELNGGNLKRTAQELSIPRKTLAGWREGVANASATIPTEASAPSRDYAALWGSAQELALSSAVTMARQLTDPTAENLTALTKLAAVASDKFLDHRDGRKGAVQIGNGADKVLVNFNV